MNERNEREELRAHLELLTDSQWEWFISAALPVLRELAVRGQLHRKDSE